MIIRKAAGEIERMARAGEVVADTLALLGEHARPGRDDAGARRARRRVHPLARRHADLQGLPRLPGLDLRLAERDGRPRHPGPVRAARRRHPVGGRRRDARRLRRRLGVHVRDRRDLRRGRAPARGLPGRARGRASSSAASATGSRTSRTRSRSPPRSRASPSCAASSATASAARCTRSRRSRTTASPAAARSSREGMTFAIEPMITAGGPGRRAARRRVVDLERGRLARRALRAHRRDHRRRPADPDRGHERRSHVNDPRVEQYAKLLVETCVDVQPGWQVLVDGERARAAAARGGQPPGRAPRRLRDPARRT